MTDTSVGLVPESSGPKARVIRLNIGGTDVDMQVIVSPPLTFIQYSDATYTYYCEAPVGTARSTALWQVSRKTNTTGDFVFAGGGDFNQVATSLGSVSSLTYTLGA